jgi:hypothetical protein
VKTPIKAEPTDAEYVQMGRAVWPLFQKGGGAREVSFRNEKTGALRTYRVSVVDNYTAPGSVTPEDAQ